MENKEIWTIDDIIEDYEKIGGISNRSKIDFLEDIKKELEELEELKKIIGTPIQDIMKRLKILEILKRVIFLTNNSYYIQTKKRLNEEDYKLIKEYLDEKEIN